MAESARARSFLAAALAVLQGATEPLTTREVARRALERGLIRSSGKTPEASMTAALYTYLRDHPDGPLVRLSEPGPARARRGSVRWMAR